MSAGEAPLPATPWLTADQAAAYLQVSKKTIYAAVASGRLRVARIAGGRDMRFRATWLDQYRGELRDADRGDTLVRAAMAQPVAGIVMRAVRLAAGRSITDVAARTAIGAYRLAAIEDGEEPVSAADVDAIARVLPDVPDVYAAVHGHATAADPWRETPRPPGSLAAAAAVCARLARERRAPRWRSRRA